MYHVILKHSGELSLKCDGTRAETTFRLSAKRTSPFKSAGASVQSTTGSRGVRIRGSNTGYTMFRGSVRVLATHSIYQFPLHFPSRASPCAITFQLDSNKTALFHFLPLRYHRPRTYEAVQIPDIHPTRILLLLQNEVLPFVATPAAKTEGTLM